MAIIDPHALDAAEVAARLATDPATGLTTAEAERRLATAGPNQLEAAPPTPVWRRAVAQFNDPLVLLLWFAIAISLAAWAVDGAEGIPFEAIVIAAIVTANAVLGLWQELRAEAAVAALQAMTAPIARVRRDGQARELAAADIVPGDILLLAEGDAVAADGRLVSRSALKVAEAPLTGESEPVLKELASLEPTTALGDRINCVYAGTAVTSGVGEAMVTATGMATEIGGIATLLGDTAEVDTPLQLEIRRIGRLLGLAVVAIAIIVVATLVLTSGIDSVAGLIDVLLVGVSLAVAAVPEGLPAILAVVLAIGVQRMAGQNAIVKKLPSVETLGSATAICSDKTGTLTRNEMVVRRVATASGTALLNDDGLRSLAPGNGPGPALESGTVYDEVVNVIACGSLANDATVVIEDGRPVVGGDPTDAAFLLAELGLGIGQPRADRFERLAEVPFTSERKLMSSVEADAEDRSHPLVATKGAPDVLLDRCRAEWTAGNVVPLTASRRQDILDGIDAMADAALRTVGVAARRLDEAPDEADELLETDLVYLGSVGILDPPRSEAAEAITLARAAGMRVLMITGDHPRTAARIAETLGIVEAPASVLTGNELDELTDEAFGEAVATTSVFARVAPEHKLRIVSALQQQSNVVAMTGDGVNDAPALKAADIGVAMGITGTEVSKEAADMILTDDNFATILKAVEQGRGIFASIQKFLRYLLSSNMGEVLTMFLGVVFAGWLALDEFGETVAVPLLATHILWINLLTDSGPALALGVDPPVGNVMNRAPRRPTDRIIDGEMMVGVMITGLTMAIATLVALDLALAGGLVGWDVLGGDAGIDEARTVAFTTLVMAQLFNAFASRSATETAFRDLTGNRYLLAAVGLSLALQVAVVHLSFMNTAFRTVPLSVGQWLACAAFGSSVLVVDEIKKAVIRFRRP